MARDEVYPHNLEAEQSLLGCLIIEKTIQIEILRKLEEDDFFSDAHKLIYKSIKEIFNANRVIDLVTLSDAMESNLTINKVGGLSYLTELTKAVPSASNYVYYFEIVKRDGVLRKLIKTASDIVEDAKVSEDADASLHNAQTKLFDISRESAGGDVLEMAPAVEQALLKYNETARTGQIEKGIYTGFKELDKLTNGFHKGDLVILAARPSIGKTALALNMVQNCAYNGNVCLVFSLEMPIEQLAQRMLCAEAEVSMQSAQKGLLTVDEIKRLTDAELKLSSTKIFVDSSSLITPPEMLAKARQIKQREGRLDFIMIDYMQLMESGKSSDNRQSEISEVSRRFKIMAKELEVPVLALSQLNRGLESRKGGVPQLSDLRESGAIEQDADIVMFIHRPDKVNEAMRLKTDKVEDNVADLLVEKHRNGPTGTIRLGFMGYCTKFVNYTAPMSDNNSALPLSTEGNVEELKTPESIAAELNNTENLVPAPEDNGVDELNF